MPTRCTSLALWAIDRVSAQMIAGRTGVPAPSSRTAPIIWPEKPTPSMRDASHSAAPSSRRVASHTACHQASGSCSALPPGPKSVSYLVVTAPSTRPSASTKVALSPVVPRSWEMIIVCDLLVGTGRGPSLGAVSVPTAREASKLDLPPLHPVPSELDQPVERVPDQHPARR